MERFWTLLVCALLILPACGNEDTDPKGDPAGEAGRDYCEVFGWYGDGHCDDVCAQPDPDCDTSLNNGSPGVPPSNANPGRPTQPPPDPVDPTDPVECGDFPGDREYYAFGDECEFLDFACVDGWSYFEDDCGCGCVWLGEEPEPWCDYDDPLRGYVSDSPEECEAIRFECGDDSLPFFDECGCGCEVVFNGGPLACFADTPDIDRMFSKEECQLVDYTCPEGWGGFEDDCGCGCKLVCSDDFECPNGFCWSDTGDAENECRYPNCDDGTEIVCMNPPPDCYDGEVLSIVSGCWECRDARTCGPSMGP